MAISERFTDKELIIKRYINSPSLLYFYGGLRLRAGRNSCSMTTSAVTDRKSCELLKSAQATLADYTILG